MEKQTISLSKSTATREKMDEFLASLRTMLVEAADYRIECVKESVTRQIAIEVKMPEPQQK